MRWLAAVLVVLAIFAPTAGAASDGLVISQVYVGASTVTQGPFNRDFVELFNRGRDPVATAGWSVQATTPAGTAWTASPLGDRTIPPGGYLLVGLGTAGSGQPIAADVAGASYDLIGAGKVALVASATPLACGARCAGAPEVVDFIGFGASANDFEGTRGPDLTPNGTALRAAGGCTDTDDNGADFTRVAAAPRNAATAPAPCTLPPRLSHTLLLSRDGLDGPAGTARSGETTYMATGLTPDGAFAAFTTRAPNLRPPGFAPATDLADVLLREIDTGRNELVSLRDGPPPEPLSGPLGDGIALEGSVSADGRRVVFMSDAPDLAPPTVHPRRMQAWVRDRQAQTTVLASRVGATPGDGPVETASISADGSTVVFETTAGNLEPAPDGEVDAFAHDLASGTTTLVSAAAGRGEQPVASADGRFVAFTASSGCLFCEPIEPQHVVLRDRQSGALEEIAVTTAEVLADAPSYAPSISADGRYVAFLSAATNLGGTADGNFNAFVRDRAAGVTYPVTPGPEDAFQATVSPDGRNVAYLDLGVGVFVRDIGDGSIDPVAGSDAGAILGVAHSAGMVAFATGADAFAWTTVSGVPENTEPPEVRGVVQVGETLTCAAGRWTQKPGSFNQQWLRDGAPIGGATTRTYTVAVEDENHGLACRVTASNAAGAGTPADSAELPVQAALPVVVDPPGLSGVPQPGQTLTCTPGTFSGQVDSIEYRWLRSTGAGPYAAIDGATGTTYVVTAADVGARVGCEAIATNQYGSRAARSPVLTAATGVPAIATAPAVTGVPAVGRPLTCTTGTWVNAPLRFSYRWLRDGQPIAGQTSSTLTMTGADRERRVACEVTASNDVGTGLSSTSASVFVAGAAPANEVRPVLALVQVGARATDYEATCSPGQWRDAPGDFTYEISYAGGEPLGSTAKHAITTADLGRELVCRVTATNALGSAFAVSNVVTVPLPPGSGTAKLYKAGGEINEFEPINFLAIAPGTAEQLETQARARVRTAFEAFTAGCRERTLEPGPPTVDPRKIVNLETRERELCRLILNTPAEQFVVGADGVRIVADPNLCVLGDDDPCARLPIPVPAPTLSAPTIDPGLQAERILWDFNSDGRLDASCDGTSPVARTIYRVGNYNVRAILVMPDSATTGVYPSATLTFRHHTNIPVPPALVKPYSALEAVAQGGRSARSRQGVVGPPTNLPTETSLKLGTLRRAQPFACKTQLAPPPRPASQPCVSEGYAGRVHVVGNLCPISLRETPREELREIRETDPALYDLLAAQNEAMQLRSAPIDAMPLQATSYSATQRSLAQFATALPRRTTVARGVEEELRRRAEKAAHALDQIYIANGPVKINGVEVDPSGLRSILFVPSDAGEALSAIDDMLVSSSRANVGLGGLDLSKQAEGFRAELVDAASAQAVQFAKQQLDGIDPGRLSLGPFRLAGTANVKLVDGAAIIEAQAELPLLKTGLGPGSVRTDVTLRADRDGNLALQGLRLRVGTAYLGAVRLSDLDLLYDGGLSVAGKILLPSNAGIEIKQFRINRFGRFEALEVNYLAGAGQGIPIGPGVFLTKLGGGLTLEPVEEIVANAAVSVGPSAGGGCPVVGGDGTMRVHFGPPPFFLGATVDLELVCLALANVEFLARSDGYVTLAGRMGFDGGPLYFNAGMRGSLLLPHWQVEGSGEGGIRDLLEADIAAVVSARGLAGCGSIGAGFAKLSGGAGVRFNPTILAGPLGILSNVRLFTGCDLSSYKTVVPPPARRQAGAPGTRPVTVAKGEELLALSVEGLDAAPAIMLRAPDGRVVADLAGAAPTVRVTGVIGIRAEEEDRTVVLVARPSPGRWTVEPAAGSVAVVRMQRAGAVPPARVQAKVTGRGPRRVLAYQVARQEGQVVRLVEEARGGGQLLGTVRGGGKGRLRFTVADARGRQRRIVAQVEQDGLPRENIVVTRFAAASAEVGRPRRVRLAPTGRLTWRRAPYATRYEVVLFTADGGRRLVATGARTSLKARAAIRATVVGLDESGRRGRAVTVRRSSRG